MDDRLGHDLRIKFGLTNDPDDRLILAWASRTAELLEQIGDAVAASRQAALEIFGELDGIFYFSQADTIEALLARATAK